MTDCCAAPNHGRIIDLSSHARWPPRAALAIPVGAHQYVRPVGAHGRAPLLPSPSASLVPPAPVTRLEWLGFALIMVVAALLRMGWPGLTEFKLDEAHLYGLALDLAAFKAFPLRGISSSVGLPNSPISVYLFALPLLFWKSPLAATLFAGLLNTASVGLTYWLARRYWGTNAAVTAGLLYATAPWAILYSRKIWAQDLLPLFTLGYVAAGLLACVERRPRWLVVHLLLLGLAAQIHLSGIALAPLTVVLLVAYRRHLPLRKLALGLALILLTLLPISLYILAHRGGLVASAVALLGRPATATSDAFSLAAMLVQGTYIHSLAGPAAFRAFDATLPDFSPLLIASGLLVLAGLLLAAWRWVRALPGPVPPATAAAAVVALWLALPVLFFVRHSTPVYPHYFIVLFPAPYLLAGLAVGAACARWRLGWPLLIPLIIAVGQAWLVLGALRFVGTQNTPQAFGTPLGRLLATVQAARALGRPEIVVVAAGQDPASDQDPAVFDVLLRSVPHRLVDGRSTAVFPSAGAAVILWPAPDGAAWPSQALYQEWGGGVWSAEVPLRAGEGRALVASSAGREPPVPQPREASALLANGVELVGAGDGGGWQLWWRAPGPQPGDDVHLFAHLLGANGALLAQVDARTYAAADWRAGDLVASYFALPAGGAAVRAGMYAYPSLAPVPVLDAAGQPAGDYLLFPRQALP